MKDNHFTVPQVPGSHRSSPRTYTHALIARFDVDTWAADLPLRLSNIEKTERDNFKHFQNILRAGVGNSWNGLSYCTVSQDQFDRATRVMADCGGTWEAYLELLQDKERKDTASVIAHTEISFAVLQWSMSEKNARAKISYWSRRGMYRADVQVVPVVQVATRAAAYKVTP